VVVTFTGTRLGVEGLIPGTDNILLFYVLITGVTGKGKGYTSHAHTHTQSGGTLHRIQCDGYCAPAILLHVDFINQIFYFSVL
jgi:hypothetical protein